MALQFSDFFHPFTQVSKPLVIAETHPVQYHAPVYRCAANVCKTPLSVVYGSDFSIAGYKDKEFGASFSWDTDLLAGMETRFLSKVSALGETTYDTVRPNGLTEMIGSLSPSAVMALGYSHLFDRAVIDTAGKLGVPLLFRGETSDHAHKRGALKRILRDWILRRLYRKCAALLYVGERSRAHFKRLGVPDSKLFFSPYCVEASTFRTSESDRAAVRQGKRSQLGIASDATVILFSGKLSERKGVDLIPQAIRLLPESKPVHLLFLGDGAMREQLELDCRAGRKVPVTFAGFQNQSALSDFYHAADLLVLPSREKETWGLVVNEALLHGLPCVVSEAVGSEPDLVVPGKTGASFEPGNALDLARALTTVIAMAGDSATAADCRSRVSDYSVLAAAEGIQKAWQQAIR